MNVYDDNSGDIEKMTWIIDELKKPYNEKKEV